MNATTLAGRYRLEQRIAVGGMGEVWLARDDVLDRSVAVKLLKPEYVADPHFLDRFRNEAKHTAALSHPGIANVFDYGEAGDSAFLVMELVDGEPLSALLARQHRLAPAQALDIVGQAALALHAAHTGGVIHRDVKPGNLLVRPDGVVKVTDFGIARAIDAAPVTQTGLVVGTAAYLSPEQAAGKPVTPASDVYALGLVAYECLAGTRAFDGDSAVSVAMAQLHQEPPALPRDVPPVVAAFVMRALEKDPARRQPDAGDFGRTALALATTLRAGETPSVAAAGPPRTKLLTAAAPAVGGDETADETADDAARRRVRNVFVAIGAAVVVLGFLLLRACDVRHPATAPSPKPTTTAAATVSVDAAAYIGRPATAARDDLRRRGLTVALRSVRSDATAGNVVAVAPTGRLPRGTTVTLSVATPPVPTPRPPHKKHRHGGKGGD
jgi:serine/threonine-protein kinase